MSWFPALRFPVHHGTSVTQLPSSPVHVRWSFRAPAFLHVLGTQPALRPLPSLFPDNTRSVRGHLWGRIQHYLSKEKEEQLMARKKLKEKFKEDTVLHVPIRLFLSLFQSTGKPHGPSNTHPRFEEEGQKRSNVAIFISSTIFI